MPCHTRYWTPDIQMVPQAFTGRHPFSEFTVPVITSEIIDGRRPARPQEAQRLGLTDSVWDMTDRCWRHDPAQRPTMRKVVRLLREWPVFSLFHWMKVLTWFLQLQDGCLEG